ncbi:ATP-citrate synthase beta chain protein 2-like [Bidens hawaiensis]|uniref:ATP-citrate synthase beta chain protein 2-like n=1 Tax=Bidens hawaiensis TaxID=980011 RepID=UPI0040499E7E
MATGQIFSRTTQALFYNYKQLPSQRMLDFDFLLGGKRLQLRESSTPVSRDFRNYSLAKKKSPYQYIQPLNQLVLRTLLLMYS